MRSKPWVHGVKKKYASQSFQVIGIHTPEFSFEKERSQVERVSKKHGDDFPIMMDNDYAFWNALGNRYWPSFYLVDKQGIIVKRVYGEMHQGTSRSKNFENEIERLLSQ